MDNYGVQFGDKFSLPNNQMPRGGESKMTDWVIKYSGGLIKDEQQANYVLIAIAIFIFFIIFMIIKPQSTGIPNEGEVKEEPMPGLSQ